MIRSEHKPTTILTNWPPESLQEAVKPPPLHHYEPPKTSLTSSIRSFTQKSALSIESNGAPLTLHPDAEALPPQATVFIAKKIPAIPESSRELTTAGAR